MLESAAFGLIHHAATAIVGDGEWDKNRRMSIGLTYVTHQTVSMKSATERDLT